MGSLQRKPLPPESRQARLLVHPAHHRRHALEWGGHRREWFSIPYMDGTTERFIWGATAAMLRNFYRFVIA